MNLEDLNCENGLMNLYNKLDEIFNNDANRNASLMMKETPDKKLRKRNRKKNKNKNNPDMEGLNTMKT